MCEPRAVAIEQAVIGALAGWTEVLERGGWSWHIGDRLLRDFWLRVRSIRAEEQEWYRNKIIRSHTPHLASRLEHWVCFRACACNQRGASRD